MEINQQSLDQKRQEVLEEMIERTGNEKESRKNVDNMTDKALAFMIRQDEDKEMDENMKGGLENFYSDRNKKVEGGYAEGSLMVPPEMEGMPVDTYDNIAPEDMEAVQASQLPDNQMEDSYLSFLLGEALDMEEQEYLMSVLETDERLNGIFDKVMDVAGEFSGEGSVDGPGTGVSDSIPARLSDGEFVITKKATDQIGADQLQTMMDDAERAYDGGMMQSKMKKAFGGLTNDPMDTEKTYMDSMQNTEEEIKRQMIKANRTPSVYSNLG
tara:strand:+ start:1766 stop:2575 length:810 start_codon:yes stop_codon:yes gene_type:complete